MTVPTPPPPVSLDLGFAPDDGNGDGVRVVFQALLSALNARDVYAATLAQQLADLQTQFAGLTTLTPARKVASGTGLTGGGDLTVDRTISIAANGVTNDLLAKVPALTLKANLLGSTANTQDTSLQALLDAVFGATQGGLLYRSVTGWGPLALGPNGTVLQSNGQDLMFGAAVAGALLAANNLSEVNPSAARANLGAAGLNDQRALAIQIAKLKGTIVNLFNSVADDFKDQSGLDAANSVNAFFDAVGNLVANLAVEATESLPAMTSNSLPSGYVASASSTVNASFDSYMAFDDNTTNAWQSSVPAPGWVQRKTPSAIKAVAYAIRGFNNGGTSLYPTAWQLQGSNDGTTFTTLDTQSGITFALSERKVFNIPTAAQAAYLYYRLNITAMNYTSVIIAEMEILQGSTAALDLRSAAFTAQAVPNKASMFALVKATAGVITPGTNLVASISRDGGTTYTPFTLTQTGTLGGFAVYEANGLDISGQPTGSSMKWRLQTTGTALGVAVDAVVAQWA